MAASNTSEYSSRLFNKLLTIQFYMEKHFVQHHQIITKRNRCQTKDARKLRIRNIVQKSKQDKLYYLGSTYTGDEEQLWIYMRIIFKKGEGSILNISAIHKKVEQLNICITFRDTVARSFESARPGENYLLRSITLSENDLSILGDKPIYIPISIEINYRDEEEERARIREVIETCKQQQEEVDRRSRRRIIGSRNGDRPDMGGSSTQ